MKFFNYCTGLTMTGRKFDEVFGGPPRKPESKLGQREMDLARSIQEVTEEVVLRLARTSTMKRVWKTSAWLEELRSTASETIESCGRVRIKDSGFSRLRAMPAGLSVRP